MAEADKLVKQAIAAYNGGRKEEARELLLQVVDQDEHHEQGWLWLSAVVDTLEEQQICLENVLAVNANNQRARKGLEAVNKKIAARQQKSSNAQPSPPASPPPSPAGRSSSAPIGAEFAEASGDSVFGQSASEPEQAPNNWFGDSGTSAPTASNAVPTSADWQAPPDQPTAYGSGKQVDQPSDQEYDDWVSSLNLDNSEADAGAPEANNSSPFMADSAPAFDDTSFMVGADEPADSQPEAQEPAFGGDLFGGDAAPWGDDPAPFAGDVFNGSDDPTGPFGNQSAGLDDTARDAFGEPEAASILEDDFTFDDDDDDDDGFAFDFDADDDSLFDDDDDEGLTSLLGASSAASTADYYQYIPKEIEPKAGLTGRAVMLLGVIVLLLLLNLASFGYLVMSL